MNRNVIRMTVGMAVACAALLVTSSADAGLFGSHGGRGSNGGGGSFGGWGGRSHGSNGGSFGGLFRRHGSNGSHGGNGGCGSSCESSCEETKCEEAAPACESCEAESSWVAKAPATAVADIGIVGSDGIAAAADAAAVAKANAALAKAPPRKRPLLSLPRQQHLRHRRSQLLPHQVHKAWIAVRPERRPR